MIKKKKFRRRKKKPYIRYFQGYVHIQCSFNNTKIGLTDVNGNVLAFASGGVAGFKKSKRSTSYAANTIASQLGEKALNLGVKIVEVKLKGLGPGRAEAVKGLRKSGLRINAVWDVTPLAHNGCRKRKKKRL